MLAHGVELFEGTSPLKKCLYLDGLAGQEKATQIQPIPENFAVCLWCTCRLQILPEISWFAWVFKVETFLHKW